MGHDRGPGTCSMAPKVRNGARAGLLVAESRSDHPAMRAQGRGQAFLFSGDEPTYSRPGRARLRDHRLVGDTAWSSCSPILTSEWQRAAGSLDRLTAG